MTVIVPSLTPRHYDQAITVDWEFDPSVTEVAYSTDGTAPVISNYIAYDTLTPPNPFIAVTQDGRGNVVYDGGFPKFYNASNTANSTATTFAQLNPAGKYLYNALNFIANPVKVAQGNRRILLIGDATAAEAYPVKRVGGSGFQDTFTEILRVAGYDLTIKDRSDWSNTIDAGIAELEEYCGLIILSSVMGTRYTTDRFVDDVVTFRERGNGVIMITDHGPSFANIDEARAAGPVGFFASVQPIAIRFGAYFDGTYDRVPVNVGFLRRTYGDHPLYANMDDSENMPAAGSESRVFVTQVMTWNPTDLLPVTLGEGRHEFNFLSVTADGRSIAQRFVYTIGGTFPVYFKSSTGVEFKSGEYNTRKSVFDLSLGHDATITGTVTGRILKDGGVVTDFTYDSATGTVDYSWYTTDHLPVMLREGDVLDLRVTSPVSFTYQVEVTRPNLTVKPPTSLAELTRLVTAGEYQERGPHLILRDYAHYVQSVYGDSSIRTEQLVGMVTQEMLGGTNHPERAIHVYDSVSAFEASMSGIPTNTNYVIVRTPFTVYCRDGSSWITRPEMSLYSFYSHGQLLRSQTDMAYVVTGQTTITPHHN